MARGYPDYFGQSIFPRYGDTIPVDYGVTATAHATTQLLSLTDKGFLLSASIEINGLGDNWSDFIKITVDGQDIPHESFSELYEQNIIHENDFIMWLTCYDINTQRYAISIIRNLQFQESLVVSYVNQSANNINVELKAAYYLVR